MFCYVKGEVLTILGDIPLLFNKAVSFYKKHPLAAEILFKGFYIQLFGDISLISIPTIGRGIEQDFFILCVRAIFIKIFKGFHTIFLFKEKVGTRYAYCLYAIIIKVKAESFLESPYALFTADGTKCIACMGRELSQFFQRLSEREVGNTFSPLFESSAGMPCLNDLCVFSELKSAEQITGIVKQNATHVSH